MDLVHNVHGIVTYISFYDYVLILKMAFIDESCCWWLRIDKVVFRLDLHLFYLQGKTLTQSLTEMSTRNISWGVKATSP